MANPEFLVAEDIYYIHQSEIATAGGSPGVRDHNAISACIDAPKATFEGRFLYDLFGMATSYISCLCIRHPFVDGNKRTGLAAALTFLHLNRYTIDEEYEEELADLVLNYITRKITQEQVADHFRKKCRPL